MRSSHPPIRRIADAPSIGAAVRGERTRMGWSQSRLTTKVGVSRFTIMRLEAGRHVPTSHLVQALEQVLEPRKRLVAAWPETLTAADPCYGPRVRSARRRRKVTAAAAAAAVGVSPATFSRFERGAAVAAIVGGSDTGKAGIRSDALAKLLGFRDDAALDEFCMA